jgi:hypothetical protein
MAVPIRPDSNANRTADTANRWGIAAAGVVMQIALGAVYAWSVFRIPLTRLSAGRFRRSHSHSRLRF